MHLPDKLVNSLDELREIVESLRARGKRIVFTNGCFDLVHRGHLEYLYAGRGLGDVLIVAVNGDASVRTLKGAERPVMPETDRAFLLAGFECVDYLYIFDAKRCPEVIATVKPDIYVKAKDYTPETLDPSERAALEECGAEKVFLEPIEGYSTSDIIRRIKELPG